ncbi:dTDP-4-dehydrorhamnose 3,5-epimerase family protein [Pedobacter sp. SYP-B3415]|uniref:dTDP-4-dehydrorhamnose 3,5-epimerase family protein n=1 Tax=Pedobacter sp. SYP-B3415 TaxID=2496641 RepID=UPI00101CCC7B|nr:dTDP-4-dehydrorhamnose 3,5-epimerase family protein [Pedobacter sp. SYP-B3415]
MGTKIIEGVIFYPVQPISTTGGRVMKGITGLDAHLPAFGECYFSTARPQDPKAWKKHSQMVCNLFVPSGAVKFVFFDDRPASPDFGQVEEFLLSEENYGRLVIEPGIWFGFSAIGKQRESIILNVASVAHDPSESERLEPGDKQIPYEWNFNTEL